MNSSGSEPPTPSVLGTLLKSLQAESDQLKQARQEFTLFSGEYRGEFARYFYYRFEVPEGLYLRGIERASFTFSQLQPTTIEGRIIGQESQFITVAVPVNFGEVLPEIKCTWSYNDHLKPTITALSNAAANHPILSLLFHPEGPGNALPSAIEPAFLPATPPDHQDAVKKIFHNRVSFLWGPTCSGKTSILALTALNFLKAGKKVLLVADSQDRVDRAVFYMLSLAPDLHVDIKTIGTRIGLPSNSDAEPLKSFSLQYDITAKRSQKQKEVEERLALLDTHWRIKVRQFLHEDFYAKLTDLRERANENRKQLANVAEELKALKETISRAQNASMLEKLKKGFSKEESAAAQKELADRQTLQKRLQSIQQALTTELIRTESQVPIEANEMRDYYAATKRLGELGGVPKVMEDVESVLAVDEREMLSSKRFVVATVDLMLSDSLLRNLQFDVVMVDDAEATSMPQLAALALHATEAMVLAGDPFQLGPESFSSSDIAQTWLQRDIFLHTAQTDRLHELFEWSQKNSQWCIFLPSQFAATLKLSAFVASVLYDDRLRVSSSPNGKGKIFFIDTSDLRSSCRQYIGKKRIVPYNDLQTKRMIEVLKHALMQPNRWAGDVCVVVPFLGTSLHTKLQLRLNALRNVEVGTPPMVKGRRKKAVIFDTTMAGVDYTMRHIDDRKIGEHRIARLFNVIFSLVEEDLYLLADMSHFRSVYKDRLFTKLLMLLQSQADPLPAYAQAARQFDQLEWDARARILEPPQLGTTPAVSDIRLTRAASPKHADVELELRMRMMARQQPQPVSSRPRNFERETFTSVHRVLGLTKDVNLLSQHIGGDILFRQSLATHQAASRLPLDVCRSDEEFRKIMEQWNLLIYEMSGAGKTDLSFFAKQTPEASVMWDISNLRAYYSSTMEAVVEEGKHRVAASVSKVFQECLGKPQPANPVEWSTAYLSFLGKMEAYLMWISEQLRR
ncbi:MAG: hypothetical protein FJ217_03220 [Ignavibacteria bacterium]|nr:hypothetical protein [Ignavibacteria bacterium]